jgi:uncharacterized membrane protein
MLLLIHHAFRYLIALSGLAVVAYALYGVVKKRPHDTTMRHLAITFRSMLDLGLFTGIVLVTTGFGFRSDLGVHVIMMLLATIVGHIVPAVMRQRRQDERTLMPYAVATVIAMVLVVLGGLALRTPEGGTVSGVTPPESVTTTLSV